MTLTISTAITSQQMITIFCFKCFTVCNNSNNLFYFIKIISAFLR